MSSLAKSKKLIIIGDSAFAEIAYEYFTYDSEYEVVAFCVEGAFLKKKELMGLPIVAFEEVENLYNPSEHWFYAAMVYTQLNRLRKRLYLAAKNKGYLPASYISSKSFVWRNVQLGEHCFIFEDNTIQPFVKIGDNVVLWSGNHIGHHSTVGSGCFIASHVVISGFCNIGQNCFIGVNATFANNLEIANDCLIGSAALVTKNVEEDMIVKGTPGSPIQSARRYFKVTE